jgi:hypothetical protein
MPTASEASAVETTEAATHMAEPSDMGDTDAVGETGTPKMGDIYAAVGETVTSDMGGTYAAAETHAVMGYGPLGAYAHVAEAMIGVTAKYSRVAVAIAVRIAVVIAKIIRACIGTAVSRIVDGAGRASVLVGVGLSSSRLRSSKCSRRQPYAGSQQDRFGGKFAAGHRSLLWGFAPQFKLVPKWDFGRDLRGCQLASGTLLLAEVLAGVMMQVPGAFAKSMGRLLEGLGVDPFAGLPGHDTRRQ